MSAAASHREEVFQTVGKVIQTILPVGTNPEEVIDEILGQEAAAKDQIRRWRVAPLYPTDLFAATAYIAKKGGLLGFFDPDPYATEPRAEFQFGFDRGERDLIDDLAWLWRGGVRGGRPDHEDAKKDCDFSESPPAGVGALWDELLLAWDRPIHCGHYVNRPAEDLDEARDQCSWWKVVIQLLLVADLSVVQPIRREAADRDWPMDRQLRLVELEVRRRWEEPRDDDKDRPAPRGKSSLGILADSTVACVGPKGRIAPVGTTLRNLTRNLSLLPGRGEMRCRWDVTGADVGKGHTDSQEQTLNLLLVPVPLHLSARDFKVAPSGGPTERDIRHRDKPNWENFRVDQSWIAGAKADEFIDHTVQLFKASWAESGPVNGVILPEYALSYTVFDRLCERLFNESIELLRPETKAGNGHRGLEFVVAGASGNCEGVPGNTVLTRVWSQGKKSLYMTNSRRKQQRWRLNRAQIETYGLGTTLSPKIANWWESTPVGQRELHFHKLRQDSLFCALICEELARSDVCHDILRSVGPNLVFALLMDSAQIETRWPAQYATALADDPGSAVLSFTSYGLVGRSNRTRKDGSRSIALWKDDTGKIRTIDMPTGEGPRGVLLSLWSENTDDQTIFGKRSNVRAWRYAGHFGVTPKGVA